MRFRCGVCAKATIHSFIQPLRVSCGLFDERLCIVAIKTDSWLAILSLHMHNICCANLRVVLRGFLCVRRNDCAMLYQHVRALCRIVMYSVRTHARAILNKPAFGSWNMFCWLRDADVITEVSRMESYRLLWSVFRESLYGARTVRNLLSGCRLNVESREQTLSHVHLVINLGSEEPSWLCVHKCVCA